MLRNSLCCTRPVFYVLLYFLRTIILLYYYTIVLLYYYTIILLYYYWVNDTTGCTLIIWRHNKVPIYIQREMSRADWSTYVFTLPSRKMCWVHSAGATFPQNCTLILDMYPVVSENETLPPAVSPTRITFRSHQRVPKHRSSRAHYTTTTDLLQPAPTLHSHELFPL